MIENAAKEVGAPISIAGFVRFPLGEGIEKKTEDFAAEVAAQPRSSMKSRVGRRGLGMPASPKKTD